MFATIKFIDMVKKVKVKESLSPIDMAFILKTHPIPANFIEKH